jgi:hypothetical protein
MNVYLVSSALVNVSRRIFAHFSLMTEHAIALFYEKDLLDAL